MNPSAARSADCQVGIRPFAQIDGISCVLHASPAESFDEITQVVLAAIVGDANFHFSRAGILIENGIEALLQILASFVERDDDRPERARLFGRKR